MRAALNETLRRDYGPNHSEEYFKECSDRLKVVEKALETNPGMLQGEIAAKMQSLSALSSRISLIERAHLGEFSWPFATELRNIAAELFQETDVDDNFEETTTTPIVHVVAEGADYQIINDAIATSSERRIIIIAFPRQLKHFVLLHSIFGHELGHTAMDANKVGKIINKEVRPAIAKGPLQDRGSILAWLRSDSAPDSVVEAANKEDFDFHDIWLSNWHKEIICDLIGLKMFGPAFVAAHRTIIGAMCPDDSYVDLDSTTHPPYPIRKAILSQAVTELGWDKPVSGSGDGDICEAEKGLLEFVTNKSENSWFALVDRATIKNTLDEISKILDPHNLGYTPISREDLVDLTTRISLERPPIKDEIDEDGNSRLSQVRCAQILYAGWTYWFGRAKLTANAKKLDDRVEELSFLELNRLCDQALLQQCAIDLAEAAS